MHKSDINCDDLFYSLSDILNWKIIFNFFMKSVCRNTIPEIVFDKLIRNRERKLM
jgi:hypothetical protein